MKKMTKAEQEAFRLKENERKRQWRLKQKKTLAVTTLSRPKPRLKSIESVHQQVDAMTMLKRLEEIQNIKEDDPFAPLTPLDEPAVKYVDSTPSANRCRADESPLSSTKEQTFTETQVRGFLTQALAEKRTPLRNIAGTTNNSSSPLPQVIPEPRKRRFSRRRTQEIYHETTPEGRPAELLDVVGEQIEKPQTTVHSPESIKEEGLKEVRKNPEYYIEINMVTDSRVVDTFFIPADTKKFHYKTKEYDVDEETIYLLPTKIGAFMPTCHYKEGTLKPRGFKQTNKGITGKALSLLYMEQLYTSLLYSEDVKYNLFIVILSIASLIAYGIGCYFLFVHEGGMLPKEGIPLPPIGLILPRWF